MYSVNPKKLKRNRSFKKGRFIPISSSRIRASNIQRMRELQNANRTRIETPAGDCVSVMVDDTILNTFNHTVWQFKDDSGKTITG